MKQIESSSIIASFKPVISVRIIGQVGILIALALVLERQFAIIDTGFMRISFSFIPMMVCGMFFGPVWGAVAYGLSDILGLPWTFAFGGPNPVILASRIVNGFIFGLFLYRENLKIWPHAVLNSFTATIICTMGLTTFGLSWWAGWGPFFPVLVTRLPQAIVFFILQIVIFPVLLKLRDALRKAGHVTTNNKTACKSE
jgi:ECF transporter S component (folate family)